MDVCFFNKLELVWFHLWWLVILFGDESDGVCANGESRWDVSLLACVYLLAL